MQRLVHQRVCEWHVYNLMKSKLFRLILVCAALPLLADDQTSGQGITRQQADAILEELKAIRQLLTRAVQPAQAAAPAPEAVLKGSLKIEKRKFLGSPTAPVTVVEFTDYQCPFCRQFHTTMYEEIRKKYIDTGKVRFVTSDFPLDIHANAAKAAEAAYCASDQNQFWQMRDVLSANAAKLAHDDLLSYARGLYLNVDTFRICLDSNKYAPTVSDNQKAASAIGVSATPTFLIGKSTSDGVNGALLVGAPPIATFEEKIKEAESQP
jgi:protein-disulfide isomerase